MVIATLLAIWANGLFLGTIIGLFYHDRLKAPKGRKIFRKNESGNIFGMMFAAVVMVGVLGVVGMQTVTGPVTTITKVTQKNMIDTDLMTNARIVILDAGTQPAGGDEDADNYVEPAPFRNDATCASSPANGGCLPSDIGAVLTDPFGTPYGYCVWDHGSSNTSTNRLQGKDVTSEAVIAVMSAGPDKIFQTSCEPFDGSGTEGLQEVTTSDDSIRIYTYDAAVAGANGLWQVKDGDPNVAQIAKNLEVGDVAGGTGFSFDTSTGEGDFPRIKTDILQPKTGQNTDMLGGLRLDDQVGVSTCEAGDTGVIRYNSTTERIEVCDGAGNWGSGGETWRIIDDAHGSDTYVTVAGTDNSDTDTISFVTNGTERMAVLPNGRVGFNVTPTYQHGDIQIAGDLGFVGHRIIGSAPALDSGNSLTFLGRRVSLGNTPSIARGYGSSGFLNIKTNSNGVNLVDIGRHTSDAAFKIKNTGGGPNGVEVNLVGSAGENTFHANTNQNRVGIGTNNPSTTLDVSGNANISNSLFVDETTLIVDGTSDQVGIGTASPYGRLHVMEGPNDTYISFGAINSSTSSGGRIWNWSDNSILSLTSTSGSESVRLSANNQVSSSWIGSSVGIGTSSPHSKLHVRGAIQMEAGSCGSQQEGAIQYTPTNNIEYCDGSGWQTITGYVDSLGDIGDVDVDGVVAGQTIAWDGTNWVATSSLDTVSAGDTSLLIDDDGDTQIQVEEGSDDDTIRFDTAGKQRMVIHSNGNVGIGIENPVVPLHVYQSSDTQANGMIVDIRKTAGGGTQGTALKIKNSFLAYHGKGITIDVDGARPSGILTNVDGGQAVGHHITMNSAAGPWPGHYGSRASVITTNGEALRVLGAPTYGAAVDRISSSDIQASFIARRARGSGATAETVQANDLIGNIVFSGYAGVSSASRSMDPNIYVPISEIRSYATAASTTGGVAEGDLRLYTNDGTALQERLRITQDGNVGIGTNTPASKLDVNGTIRAQELCDENGANCQDLSSGGGGGSISCTTEYTTVGPGGTCSTSTRASAAPACPAGYQNINIYGNPYTLDCGTSGGGDTKYRAWRNCIRIVCSQ